MKTLTPLSPLRTQLLELYFLLRFRPLLALLAWGVLASTQSRAETLLWTNITGGNWNVAANWEPNRVPASGDEVIITNAGLLRKTAGPGTTTIHTPFHNTGTISVRSGTLNFSRSPTLGATTAVEIGLAGPSQTRNYGRITCDQAIQLTGHLAVTFAGGFLPDSGEDYPVIVAPIRGAIESFSAPPVSPEVFINPVYTASAVHLVTTDPTPALAQPGTDAEGRFTLDIHGIASQWYGIEATTDFVEWTPLTTNAIPASTVWRFVDEDSLTIPDRFYRVWFEPQAHDPGAPRLPGPRCYSASNAAIASTCGLRVPSLRGSGGAQRPPRRDG